MLKYWRTFKRLGLMGSKHEGKKIPKTQVFWNILAYKIVLKLTYSKVEFQKFSRGRNPRTPVLKGSRGRGWVGGWGAGGGVGAQEENVQFRLPNPTFTTAAVAEWLRPLPRYHEILGSNPGR